MRLRGEISGFRGPHASGHAYFALKDDSAKIDAVIWKGTYSRLKVRPEEGMEVIAQGRVTSYPGSSKYQIVIDSMEPAGVGALMALLEERKRRLTAEGLFAEDAKRPLPFMPRVIGIVTSPTGAVIRDMLAGFAERFPARVLLWPVRVQGETAGAEVAAAIDGFNRLTIGGPIPRPDVLIVARGGGSLEDLWGFNDEIVVRAAAASTIPLVSAVGHETDWTLLDLVADARAPTPTKAAEWVVPMYCDLLAEIGLLDRRLAVSVRRSLSNMRTHLRSAARGLPRLEDLVALPRQRFDTAQQRLERGLIANTRAHASRLSHLDTRLTPRLLQIRLARASDKLTSLATCQRDALARLTAARRSQFASLTAHLRPRVLEIRLARLDERLASLTRRKSDALSRLTAARARRFASITGALRPAPLLHRMERCRDTLRALEVRNTRALCHAIDQRGHRLASTGQMLAALGHRSVLARGFAIVRDGNGAMIRSATSVKPGAALGIEFQDGDVRAQALEGGQARDRDAPPDGAKGQPNLVPAPTRSTKPRSAPTGGDQGSLF